MTPSLETIGWRLRCNDKKYPAEIERCFLSAMIAGGNPHEAITENLFYDKRNKVIFRALCHLRGVGLTGFETLLTFLEKTGLYERAGGYAYLADIESAVGIPSAMPGYDLALLRLRAEGR